MQDILGATSVHNKVINLWCAPGKHKPGHVYIYVCHVLLYATNRIKIIICYKA